MNWTKEELEALFNRCADGIASEADEQQLGDLLRSNPETRRAFREFMALHTVLQWNYVAAVSKERSARMSLIAPVRASRTRWFVAFAAGVAAASIMVIAVLKMFDPADSSKSHSPTTSLVPKTDSVAALLVSEAAAEFASGRAPNGVQFASGEYELLKGVVHLRFAQGAEMVLSAPARFVVTDSQHVRLAYGKLRVTVPPTAKGFTIATLAADYVDLGTEFGLSVDPGSSASDLYVFDGQVNIADPKSGKVLSEIKQGKSSRYVDGVIGVAPTLKQSDFPPPGSIGFQRWEQHERELQKSSGLLAFFPFRKTADESVLTNANGGQAIADGRIAGARWVSGRWPGKEALLFDRDTDFVQLEIPGEYQELTIATWLKIDRLDFELNSILNSDGYDPGDIHFQLNRQGFPRGGVVFEGSYKDKVLNCSVPVGRWTHVASVLSTRTRSQQIYVNGVLSRERQWPKDEALRPGSCRLGNWLSDTKIDPSNRALRGRVDELAIWGRALSADEVLRLAETGMSGITQERK